MEIRFALIYTFSIHQTPSLMKTLLIPAALLLLVSCQPTNRKSISNETLTQTVIRGDEGKAMLLSTSAGMSEPEDKIEAVEESFTPKTKALARYLKHFPKTSQPMAFNSKAAKRFSNKDLISYDFVAYVPEMEVEQFSREVGKEFYYMTRVSEGTNYAAVIYAVKNVMMGDNAPYGYVLASYNPKGKLIDKLVLGGKIEMDEALRVGSIAADGTIEVKEFSERWKNNPEQEGYYENKVVSTRLKRTKQYSIKADGHIRRENVVLAMR
jgi:hypothetical protein